MDINRNRKLVCGASWCADGSPRPWDLPLMLIMIIYYLWDNLGGQNAVVIIEKLKPVWQWINPSPPGLLISILTCTSCWCGARWPPSCGHGRVEPGATRDPPWSWPCLETCNCHYSLVHYLLLHRLLLLHCFLQEVEQCEGHRAGPHCDSWGCAQCTRKTPASWPRFPGALYFWFREEGGGSNTHCWCWLLWRSTDTHPKRAQTG